MVLRHNWQSDVIISAFRRDFVRLRLPLNWALNHRLVFRILAARMPHFHKVLRALLARLVQESREAGHLIIRAFRLDSCLEILLLIL